MVGQRNTRDLEARYVDAVLVEHEIELLAWSSTRVGRCVFNTGGCQSRRFNKQVDLVLAPEGIEISCDDNGLFRRFDQIVEAP